jgi:hypothetical protein
MTTYPGDIVIVRYPTRHALVLNADTAQIHICLLSNEVDLAMDSDIILEPTETRLPYRLMAETSLIGRVGFRQVVRKVGQTSDSLVNDILDFIWDERPDSLDPLRGLPSRCPGLGRQELERFEASDLAALCNPTRGTHPLFG